MSPRAVRYAAMAVCVLVGIPGMIVSSITDHDGAAVTFGLLAAVASLCLILVTAVRRPDEQTTGDTTAAPYDEQRAAEVEDRIEALVEEGADEEEVRDLVRAAVHLGRGAGGPPNRTPTRTPAGGRDQPR